MSTKYEKSMQISKEEEGAYHRREYLDSPASSRRSAGKQKHPHAASKAPAHRHRSHSPSSSSASDSDDEDPGFQEWTTSKRKVNHKTRQVETRVSRQLVMEDGRVIADSGPQVTTRIKEDNKLEECERERAPKNRGRFEALENAPEARQAGGGRVLGEKKEIQRVSREVREENMQYHDERFKELSGADVHRRAAKAPHELITVNDDHQDAKGPPRGKMVHYSNKGKKYQDTDEILEVAKLALDGSISKERTHTRHHEEFSEDEKPDERGEAEELRRKPIATRASRKHFDYVNDFNDFSTPQFEDEQRHDDERDSDSRSRHRHIEPSTLKTTTSRHAPTARHYEGGRDPLLNSLNDDDFQVPITRYDEHEPIKPAHKHHSSASRQRKLEPVHSSSASELGEPDSTRGRHSSTGNKWRAHSPSSHLSGGRHHELNTSSANRYKCDAATNTERARSMGVASPTPSAGQRSVKTTTTTLSGGLAERPPRRHQREAESARRHKSPSSRSSSSLEDLRLSKSAGSKGARHANKPTKVSSNNDKSTKSPSPLGAFRKFFGGSPEPTKNNKKSSKSSY